MQRLGVIDTLTADQGKALLLDDHLLAREWFRRTFSRLVRETAVEVARVHNAQRHFASKLARSERAAAVLGFTHTALHSLVTSVQLLLSGYPVLSGHMMRQYAECSVMAVLCAVTETEVFDRYIANPQAYPVHQCMELMGRRSIRKPVEDRSSFSHEE